MWKRGTILRNLLLFRIVPSVGCFNVGILWDLYLQTHRYSATALLTVQYPTSFETPAYLLISVEVCGI